MKNIDVVSIYNYLCFNFRFKVDKFALYSCDVSDEGSKRRITFRDVGVEVWADYICDKEGLEHEKQVDDELPLPESYTMCFSLKGTYLTLEKQSSFHMETTVLT